VAARTSRLLLAASLAAALSRPSAALAWDAEAHQAILDMALLLSPAAASRLPAEYREELRKELRYPDSRDTLCRTHRGPAARVDAFAEAERELAALSRAGAPLRPYERAKAVGRYLHWVADAVTPRPIASGKVCEVLDFWANKDFVVFRERSPLSQPLAAALRARAARAEWADDTPAAQPAVLRLAVNATIEALHLLPAPAGGPALPDEGPVLFLVNRIDTGLSGMRTGLYYYEVSVPVGGGYVYEESGVAEIRSGGQGERKADLMQRQRVQVAEQSARTNPAGGASIRALVFNNLKVPACGVTVQSGRWSVPVSGTLPPGALRLASFDVPAGVDLQDLRISSQTSGCAPATADGIVPTDRRLVLGTTGSVPRLAAEGASTVLQDGRRRGSTVARGETLSASAQAHTRATGAPDGEGSGAVSVTIDRPETYGLGAPVEVLAMEVDPGPFEWRVRAKVRSLREVSNGQVRLVLASSAGEGSAGPETEFLWLDVRRMTLGETRTFDLKHTPRKAATPKGLRLVDIRASS
jgi:hypothetical protein